MGGGMQVFLKKAAFPGSKVIKNAEWEFKKIPTFVL